MDKTKILRGMVFIFFFFLAGGLYLYSVYSGKEETMVQGVVSQTGYQEQEDSPELMTSDKVTAIQKKVKEASNLVENNDVIYVHVCGNVLTPGVYELTQKDRVIDAINKADGFCDGAAKDAINQAQLLIDGQRLYIPSLKEIRDGIVTVDLALDVNCAEKTLGLININKASKQELMTLPGIGEAKAESIISYREENDGFQSIEDLQKIVGIKETIFQKVKDFITAVR
jgi:competence protein ComEA